MQLNADAQKIIDDLRAADKKYIKYLEKENAAKDEIIKIQDDIIKKLKT